MPVDPALSSFVRPIVETVFSQLLLAHAIEYQPFPLEEFRFEDPGTKIDATVASE